MVKFLSRWMLSVPKNFPIRDETVKKVADVEADDMIMDSARKRRRNMPKILETCQNYRVERPGWRI